MFNRFKNSLFKPSLVSEYRNDKFYITLIYFIILMLILAIPRITIHASGNRLDYNDRLIIENSFRDTSIPYMIKDSELKRTEGEDLIEVKLTETVKVIFIDEGKTYKSSISLEQSIIIFQKDALYYSDGITSRRIFNYSDYEELNNLDLSKATSKDKEFWELVFKVANDVVQKDAKKNFVKNIFASLFEAVFNLLIFSLLLTLLQKMTLRNINALTFYKLSIYLLTPYVLLNVLGFLYQIGILSYLGILLSAIFSGIVARKLTVL